MPNDVCPARTTSAKCLTPPAPILANPMLGALQINKPQLFLFLICHINSDQTELSHPYDYIKI